MLVNDLDSAEAEAGARNSGNRRFGVGASGDVTGDDFAQGFISAALSAFGDIHILVNNAGYVWNGPLHKISDQQWDAIQNVHLKAPFRILRELRGFLDARVAEERRSGAVILSQDRQCLVGLGDRWRRRTSQLRGGEGGFARLDPLVGEGMGPARRERQLRRVWLYRDASTQEISGETVVTIDGAARRVGSTRPMIEALKERIALGRAGLPDEAAGGIMLFCFPESTMYRKILEVSGGLAH